MVCSATASASPLTFTTVALVTSVIVIRTGSSRFTIIDQPTMKSWKVAVEQVNVVVPEAPPVFTGALIHCPARVCAMYGRGATV